MNIRTNARWIERFALAAIFVGLCACVTDAGHPNVNYDRSILLATSAPAVAMTQSAGVVYWMDANGVIWSCDDTHCNDAPAVFYGAAASASGQLAVAGGWLYWLSNQTLYGCPTTGCPLGSASPLTGDTVNSFVSDADAVYWLGTTGSSPGFQDESNATTIKRITPGCGGSCVQDLLAKPQVGVSAVCDPTTETCPPCTTDADCAADSFCAVTSPPSTPNGLGLPPGLDPFLDAGVPDSGVAPPFVCSQQLALGASCGPYYSSRACAMGACEGAECRLTTSASTFQPASAGLAVAGGSVYFVSGTSILSCPVTGCFGTTANPTSPTAIRTDQQPSSLGQSPIVLGANAQSVYLSDAAGFQRCDLPECDGKEVVLGQPIATYTGGNALANAPAMLFTSSRFLVLRYDIYGWQYGLNNGYPYAMCSSPSCPGGPAPLEVDPQFVASAVGLPGAPVALEEAATLWATTSVFGQPGSLIMRTPWP